MFVFGAVVALSLTQSPAAVSLPQALNLSRAGHPALAAARARVKAGAADESVASAQWLPRVALMAQWVASTTNNSTATVISSPAVDLPRIGATPVTGTPSMAPEISSAVAVGLRQQLFDFGKTSAELRAAVARTDIERRRLELTTVELDIEVTQGWYAVKAADAVLKSSQGALERAVAHAELTAAATRANLRAPVDMARVQAEVERARVAVLRAQAQRAIARRQLALAVGAGTDDLDAAGEAPEPPTIPPLDELLATATQSDLRVREAAARLEALHQQTASLAAQWRPTLLASAALSGRAGGSNPSSGTVPIGGGALPVVPNWDVGVVLSWPALEPVAIARARSSTQTEAAASAELDAIAAQQRSAATVAWLEADVSVRALPALQAAEQTAEVAQQQADARFRLGLGSLLELTDAESLRTEAEVQLALGRLARARATAALTRFGAMTP